MRNNLPFRDSQVYTPLQSGKTLAGGVFIYVKKNLSYVNFFNCRNGGGAGQFAKSLPKGLSFAIKRGAKIKKAHGSALYK
ncbi:hypothetical protein CHY_1062 [Carboxydothermus hydrogenoformans Z-2901]|uniref:Uncharacterized protein n=1 Tax=Carboxydothermus hydrogenoformans (strain ATCC BAA-161 / DSM 6008 / Z-2901) TaxID=246194 RepID=Q3AD76_CARHZ|nr:hypothetical protein CHY_1062 [Carboxydothermus hydrogenoformans Z-2901]